MVAKGRARILGALLPCLFLITAASSRGGRVRAVTSSPQLFYTSVTWLIRTLLTPHPSLLHAAPVVGEGVLLHARGLGDPD